MPDLGSILDLLERDGALDLRPEPTEDSASPAPDYADDSWPIVEPGEEILEVDIGRLFPRSRPTDRGEYDFEFYGDDWEFDDDLAGEIEEAIGSNPNESDPPLWDVWAWYQPIHFFGPRWGIFIRERGLLTCANRILHTAPPAPGRLHGQLAKAVIRAAFGALFLHEHYHHKTESLGIRLHVVERRPIYPDYHRNVYRATAGTSDQIEEGLANADSWFRLAQKPYSTWCGKSVISATRDYLKRSFSDLSCPPGYANAELLLAKADFDHEQNELFARVQDGHPHSRPFPSELGIATHLNRGLFNVSQRIWTVVPSGRRSVLPVHPWVAPLTTSKLVKVLKDHDFKEVKGQGKGSHRKYRDEDGRMMPVPDSKDVSLPVMKTAATMLGVNIRELEELARNV